MFVFVSGRNVTFVKKSSLDPIMLACEHYIRYDCVLSGVAVATLATAALCNQLELDWTLFTTPLVERVDNMKSVIVKASDIRVNKKQFTSTLTSTLNFQASEDHISSTNERLSWGSGFFVVSYAIGEVRALNKDETSVNYSHCGEIICV